MRIPGWIVVTATLGLMCAPALAQALPLPGEPEIPEDYATLLCQDVAGGQDVLANYLAPGEHSIDTTIFLEGLKLNDCFYKQDRVGPIKIESVIERRVAQPGQTYILYRGTMADGTDVIGILHEEGYDAYPRTEFQQFLAESTRDGVVLVSEGERGAYICASTEASMAVLDSIGQSDVPDEQLAALDRALNTNGCAAAIGEFRIIERHGDAYIAGGYEADEIWTALTAIDQSEKTVSLLYDASPFR
jgi:hypothetical protein